MIPKQDLRQILRHAYAWRLLLAVELVMCTVIVTAYCLMPDKRLIVLVTMAALMVLASGNALVRHVVIVSKTTN